MALVLASVYTYSATFVDKDGNTSTMSFFLDATLDVPDALAAGQAVVAAAAVLSNAEVIRDGLNIGRVDNALDPATIAEASDVERKAVYRFKAANGQDVRVEIPSIDNQYVNDGTEDLISGNAAVQAFATTFLNTGLGPANSPVTNVGADIVRFVPPAYKRHRGTNRG